MTSQAEQWITEGKSNGTLVAAFVDCQNIEHIKPYRTATFNRIAAFGDALRQTRTTIAHFIYIVSDENDMKPFQYKETFNDESLIPDIEDQFAVAIPDGDEWVYPKASRNGFKNAYSCNIIKHDYGTIVFAGFTSADCVARSMAGSFAHALSPENHRVILASDATDNYKKGITKAGEFLSQNENFAHLKTNISHAPITDIMRCIR